MPRALQLTLAFLISYLVILSLSYQFRGLYDLLITKPVEAIDALKELQEFKAEEFTRWFFFEERGPEKGVTRYDKERSYNGYTLYSTVYEQKAFLIDMDGGVVHSWHKPFEEIWPDPVADYIPPAHKIFWCRVWLEGNGDLYIQYCIDGPGNKAVGLTKLDKDSNLVWKYEDYSHHDMEIAGNGNIYVLVNTIRHHPHEGLPFVEKPFMDEFIVTLDPDGNEIARASLFDMMYDSPARSVLELLGDTPSDPKLNDGDLLHPNTITVITDEIAGKAPMLKAGDVMVSFRNIDLLATFDLDSKKMTWASYGPWRAQHAPEFFSDGTMVLFDNEGNVSQPGGPSRLLHMDLNDLSVLWEYIGSEEDPFYTPYNGFIQPLPNGNVLATETSAGRLFEVSRDKTIVWEYYVPERLVSDGASHIPSVFSGWRFTEEQLPFIGP
jgi:hypothetical protein